MKSLIIGGPGPYVPYPSHSFLTPIGPTAWLLMLDCRCVDFYGSGQDDFLTLASQSRTETCASM